MSEISSDSLARLCNALTVLVAEFHRGSMAVEVSTSTRGTKRYSMIRIK